ncbi:pyrroline-5-carboxylate reductase [Hazenella coriacea]|uniref:Pyrroline-5-carboxylate reductase n=2 Tax=Hazenella coriacea TaxID=1179467 RepID=A0A4R3L492_9BACL|nr:pyrroline-5-carboxylate reductase [Hazenella coriacea]
MLKNRSFGFIGAGSMAESILAGLFGKSEVKPHQVAIINRSDQQRLELLSEKFGFDKQRNITEKINEADIILLTVKPKDMNEVMLEWGQRFRKGQLIISVVAGISTSFIERNIAEQVGVIRVMPNTSCAVGLSATAICRGRWVEECELELVRYIFSLMGSVEIVEEKMMDAVTGLSGSGPAYVYYLIESLEAAGVHAGLQSETARHLAIQTLLGATEMLVRTGKEAAQLRREVTSPGGTTMAGLKVLDQYRFQEALVEAVHRAAERSREMEESYTS